MYVFVYVNKFISEISIGEVLVEAEASKNTINRECFDDTRSKEDNTKELDGHGEYYLTHPDKGTPRLKYTKSLEIKRERFGCG